MKNKYVCLHGHFYQPPRENPWLGEIEPEESASPHRDWNSRVFSECYGPNAASPFFNSLGQTEAMDNNYALMSFNFGPTLLSWIEKKRPRLYDQIRLADSQSRHEQGGHGNALAHPYVHAILPLASPADKRTLIRWGIADFRCRFGREPEGFWLPETGVDEETLEALIAEGLRFTLLAPSQASRVRTSGSDDAPWQNLKAADLDCTRPYRWRSKKNPGSELAIFFYQAELARGIDQEGLLLDGKALARKILSRFLPDESTQLVSAASDGEFYGHHTRQGNQALGLALRLLKSEGVRAVNYARFLSLYPPPQEIEIRPYTAWSCAHGLGRWTEDCGCRSSTHSPWHQKWRKPLRAALDDLRDGMDWFYEKEAAELLKNPAQARDAYVEVPLKTASSSDFLARHSRKTLSPEEARRALRLLEMQRHRLLMYTSCAWFFDDISGLEAVQSLKHAGRAVDIAASLGKDLSARFQEMLKLAPSNTKIGDGAAVYRELVEPRRVDIRRAAAHFALLDLLEGADCSAPLYSFSLERQESVRQSKAGPAGKDRAFYAVHLKIHHLETLESLEALVVVHQQDRLDLACWVVAGNSPLADLSGIFLEKDDGEFRHEMASRFGQDHFTLDALFAEERRAVVSILVSSLPGSPHREFLTRWIKAVHKLRRGAGGIDALLEMIEKRPAQIQAFQLPLMEVVRLYFQEQVLSLFQGLDAAALSRLLRWLEVAEAAELFVNDWERQNLLWDWRAGLLNRRAKVSSAEWDAARTLGRKLNFSDAVFGDANAETGS